MYNADVLDLYGRVGFGTPVVVMQVAVAVARCRGPGRGTPRGEAQIRDPGGRKHLIG